MIILVSNITPGIIYEQDYWIMKRITGRALSPHKTYVSQNQNLLRSSFLFGPQMWTGGFKKRFHNLAICNRFRGYISGFFSFDGVIYMRHYSNPPFLAANVKCLRVLFSVAKNHPDLVIVPYEMKNQNP